MPSINDELVPGGGLKYFADQRERAAEPTRLITIKDWCEITSMAERTVRQWINTGVLRAVSGNGHHIRIPVTEIERVFRPVEPSKVTASTRIDMSYFLDPHRIDEPSYRSPREREAGKEPPPVMTIAGRTASQEAAIRAQQAQQPRAETPVGLAFQAFDAAVAAQRDLNAEVDAQFDREQKIPPLQRTLTAEAVRLRKATIANSPAATLVDTAEPAVADREVKARQRYDAMIEGYVRPGDSAQEQRNTRYAQRVARELAAADNTSQKVAVASRLLEKADPAQRGVLVEELPSLFAGSDVSWMERKLEDVDPQLASATTEVRLATQCNQMAQFAAKKVRDGFATGTPPVALGVLAPAIERLDPDAM